ncbi:MAG: ubiquitin carboxyl-terminal hydrolase, partial [Dasosvirus sp.]
EETKCRAILENTVDQELYDFAITLKNNKDKLADLKRTRPEEKDVIKEIITIITKMYRDDLSKFLKIESIWAWEKILKDSYSIINEIFSGMSLTTITCQECKNVKINFERFDVLTLHLPTEQTQRVMTQGVMTQTDVSTESVTGKNVSTESVTGKNVSTESVTGKNVSTESVTGKNVSTESVTGKNVSTESVTGKNVSTESVTGKNVSTERSQTHDSKSDQLFTLAGLTKPERSDITLDDLFAKYIEDEKMIGSNQYYCNYCMEKKDAIQNHIIWNSPDKLVIMIKKYRNINGQISKVNTKVSYQHDLDISKYMHSQENNQKYELYATIRHSGIYNGGHYYSYIKNPISGQWFLCDDESVYHVENDEVLKSNSYVLFYQKKI